MHSLPLPKYETSSRKKKLPFTRFHVKLRPAGDSLPEGMENVPFSVWTDFWSKIDLIVKQIDRARSIKVLTFILLTLICICLFLYFRPFTGTFLDIILDFGFIFIIPLIIHVMYWKTIKLPHLEKIKAACREEELSFQSLGFSMEYKEERPNDGRPNGDYVYFYPIKTNETIDSLENPSATPDIMVNQHGYLRVELAKDPRCGWQTTPSLPNYEYLPNGMESVSLATWTEFWSKIDAASSSFVSARRRLYLLLMVYLGMLIIPDELWEANDALVIVDLVLVLTIFVGAFYYMCRFQSLDTEVKAICHEYADTFKQQGVYMEFRTELDWSTFGWTRVDGYFRWYIYMFPGLDIQK